MTKFFVGRDRHIKPPAGGILVIEDEVRAVPRTRIFDPTIDSFNPLDDLDYRKACAFVDTIDALFTRGENTLTKDTGLEFIAAALDEHPRTIADLIPEPDKKSSLGHVWAYSKIQRLLRSPVLKAMLSDTTFSFKPTSRILARVNRAELGTFDALAIGLFLMDRFQGQIVVPDFGLYVRETHADLVHQNRLIAGVNTLSELPPKLRQLALLSKIVPCGTTFDDAQTLADAAGLPRGIDRYSSFVQDAMTPPDPEPVRYLDPRAIKDRTRRFKRPKRAPKLPKPIPDSEPVDWSP